MDQNKEFLERVKIYLHNHGYELTLEEIDKFFDLYESEIYYGDKLYLYSEAAKNYDLDLDLSWFIIDYLNKK